MFLDFWEDWKKCMCQSFLKKNLEVERKNLVFPKVGLNHFHLWSNIWNFLIVVHFTFFIELFFRRKLCSHWRCRKVFNKCWQVIYKIIIFTLIIILQKKSFIFSHWELLFPYFLSWTINSIIWVRRYVMYNHRKADRRAHKFVWLLSANQGCVLWSVDQWERSILVALNLWALLSACPWIW